MEVGNVFAQEAFVLVGQQNEYKYIAMDFGKELVFIWKIFFGR